MSGNYLIYKFTSPSGKSYIGLTSALNKRINRHKNSSGCKAFAAAIAKYGFESFVLSILKENLTLEEAQQYEKIYIQEYKTQVPYGYNITLGGEGLEGYIHADSSKQRMREKKLGRLHTEETKDRIRQAHLGKKHSEAARHNMSKAQLGNTNNLGKHLSEQTKAKISKANLGKKQPAQSEESLRNRAVAVAEAIGRKVICTTTGEIFNTITEAQKKTGALHVSSICRGDRLSSKGLTFEYLD